MTGLRGCRFYYSPVNEHLRIESSTLLSNTSSTNQLLHFNFSWADTLGNNGPRTFESSFSFPPIPFTYLSSTSVASGRRISSMPSLPTPWSLTRVATSYPEILRWEAGNRFRSFSDSNYSSEIGSRIGLRDISNSLC